MDIMSVCLSYFTQPSDNAEQVNVSDEDVHRNDTNHRMLMVCVWRCRMLAKQIWSSAAQRGLAEEAHSPALRTGPAVHGVLPLTAFSTSSLPHVTEPQAQGHDAC